MNSKILPNDRALSRAFTKLPYLDNLARNILFSKFKDLKHGILDIEDQGKTYTFGSSGEFHVKITVLKASFYSRTLFGGSIGNSESYVDQDWECSDLTALIRLFVKNREITQGIDSGLMNLFSPIQKIFHGFRHNSIQGSQENIKSHYDMGNDFFKLFLDPTMMYSSAIYENKETTLEEAALTKIKKICERLCLKPEHHLLEIGSGWGALATYAAKEYGCKVTTTTISKEQYNLAQKRVQEMGLQDKVQVLLEDYRNLTGQYDRLVSVEMIEAVGLDNLDTYFKTCSDRLKDNGLMVLQAITIRDQFYESAKNSVDFIQRHIFPGSGIPSIHSIMNAIATKTDLIMIAQQDYAEDYAQTLRDWDQRFKEKTDEVLKLGYPSFLPRLWHYYFSYCEGGFRERAIGLSQIVFAKPSYKNRSLK